MRARRPAAAGEPAGKRLRQDIWAFEDGHPPEVIGRGIAVEGCATTTRLSTGTPFSLRTAALARCAGVEAGSAEHAAYIVLAMGIAQRRQQFYAVAGMGLDREGEQTIRGEDARNAGDDRREIVDIDKDIGGEDEVIVSFVAGFVGQKIRELCSHEPIVKALGRGLRDHGGRKIDADQPIDIRPERGAAEAGAAAEVEHRAEAHRASGRAHDGFDRVVQQRRAAIMQALGERRVVARGILVEQPADIGFGHGRRRFAGAEPRQLQPRAVIILGIGIARLLEGGNRAVAIAELVADGAEREPGRGEARRQLHGLRQNVGGAGHIALRGMIERPFVAPVGDQVAGGDKERAGVGHRAMLAWRSEMTIYDSRCDLKTYWCRRRPASAANWAASISTRRGRSSGR